MKKQPFNYPATVRRIANDTFDLFNAGYILCADGNVWHYGTHGRSNNGPLVEFMQKVETKQIRGVQLLP
jgi:hypothetical protein